MDELIAEKHLPGNGPDGPITRTVQLFRRPDGSTYCMCPYYCLATYERCEFEGFVYTKPEPYKPGFFKRLLRRLT